jgi:Flp pilus assembly protein TadB
MKYLNLFSLIAVIVLISSCHSTEVSLRGSKVQELPHSEQDSETEKSTFASSESQVVAPSTAKNTPHQEVNTLTDQANAAVINDNYTPISQKGRNTQTVHTSSKTAQDSSVKPKIKLQFNHPKSHATASKNLTHPSKGLFGSVGRSFGVVGVVFIFVGLILFLIGGLLIDTLGALFLGFGLVFLLIWLVLAVLQGLFDVIL